MGCDLRDARRIRRMEVDGDGGLALAAGDQRRPQRARPAGKAADLVEEFIAEAVSHDALPFFLYWEYKITGTMILSTLKRRRQQDQQHERSVGAENIKAAQLVSGIPA